MADATQRAVDLFGGAVTLVPRRRRRARPGAAPLRGDGPARVAAVFGEGDEREAARWLIWELGQAGRAAGVDPGSVHGARPRRVQRLHRAGDQRARAWRTTPRARSSGPREPANAGAFILEIARSEIAYTDQRPAEYVAVHARAALREGFRGPVFIQGDHFQVNAKKYAVDPEDRSGRGEAARRARRSPPASTTSTSIRRRWSICRKPTLDEQQRLNYERRRRHLATCPRARAQGRDDLRRRRDRRSRHAEQHGRRAARVHGRLQRGARRQGDGGALARSACSPERRTAASCSPTARSPT